MPCISSFYGLLIYSMAMTIIRRIFHINYGGKWSVCDFDRNIIDGELPSSKQKLVSAWAEIHRDELIANWELSKNKENLVKILPLQ